MKKFLKNYWFILCMLTGIVAGCLVGAFDLGSHLGLGDRPQGADGLHR